MTFIEGIKSYWLNYANFKGRSSKAAYWWAVLFLVLANIAISRAFPAQYINLMGDLGNPMDDRGMWADSPASNLWSVATFLPSLSLLVRRLHDTNRSGRNAWWALLPIAGWIILLVYVLQPSVEEGNNYN